MTCVAAKATIDLIEEDRLMDNAETVGNYLHAGLEALKEKHAIIGDVRGMGLMQGIELVKDRKTKEPADDLTNQLLERLRVHGLLVGKAGSTGTWRACRRHSISPRAMSTPHCPHSIRAWLRYGRRKASEAATDNDR